MPKWRHRAPGGRSWFGGVALPELATFAGAGLAVAVGYIDPGNWATDLAGGSRFGYAMLSVVLSSSLAAMLLQVLSARLGVVTRTDLASACRESYPRLAWAMWLTAEGSIVATDVAELVGSALALKLLFGLPLRAGVILTAADVLLVLTAGGASARASERVASALLAVVAAGLMYEIWLVRPGMGDVVRGYVPSIHWVRDPEGLALAVAIVGATVMPHNLYLHSHLAALRPLAPVVPQRDASRRALRAATLDAVVSLALAMVLNSALLVLAASLFHGPGRVQATELPDAHRLLARLLGKPAAGTVFAVGLLAAGQSATLTGTLAGQVVGCGFMRLRVSAPVRRLLTRALAVVPALVVLTATGDAGVDRLLVGSQVVLGFGLPGVIVPLLLLTADRASMGELRAPRWMTTLGWICGLAVCLADGLLVATWMGR